MKTILQQVTNGDFLTTQTHRRRQYTENSRLVWTNDAIFSISSSLPNLNRNTNPDPKPLICPYV